VTFYQPVTVNGTELKAGDYKLELQDNGMAVIKQGKVMTEAPVKIENASEKFSRSSVRITGNQLEEIRLGGTSKRVVFEKSGTATN
jgi:hypothetical protein